MLYVNKMKAFAAAMVALVLFSAPANAGYVFKAQWGSNYPTGPGAALEFQIAGSASLMLGNNYIPASDPVVTDLTLLVFGTGTSYDGSYTDGYDTIQFSLTAADIAALNASSATVDLSENELFLLASLAPLGLENPSTCGIASVTSLSVAPCPFEFLGPTFDRTNFFAVSTDNRDPDGAIPLPPSVLLLGAALLGIGAIHGLRRDRTRA